MTKLHEILAVEAAVKTKAKVIVEETIGTFKNKTDLFNGHMKTLSMFDESRKNEEEAGCTSRDVNTTVMDKLDHLSKEVTRYFDVSIQKEATNQSAMADVKLDGQVVLTGVPATGLLMLENKLTELRQAYLAIPTRNPAHTWIESEDQKPGVMITQETEVKNKTEQTIAHKIIVPATEHHPAQVEKWKDNTVIGNYREKKLTGMISSAQKNQIIDRLDTLIQAIKKARARANNEEVVKINVGKTIFDYINHGKI